MYCLPDTKNCRDFCNDRFIVTGQFGDRVCSGTKLFMRENTNFAIFRPFSNGMNEW